MKTRTFITIQAVLCTVFLAASCKQKDDETGKSGGDSAPEKQEGEKPPAAEHKAIVTDKLEPYECGDIATLHTYQGVFLASQPKPADFEQAKKGGIKTVINLRHTAEIKDFDEKKVVEDLGLAYLNPAFNGPEELTDEIFDELRSLLKKEERPILLHCGSSNRVGAVWMAYRVLDTGQPLDEAMAEAKVVGLKSPDYEAKANDYIARHQDGKGSTKTEGGDASPNPGS